MELFRQGYSYFCYIADLINHKSFKSAQSARSERKNSKKSVYLCLSVGNKIFVFSNSVLEKR